MKKIKRILIANRGEIAIRIIKTCREMGIETVSVYTEMEKDHPHGLYSDYGVCLKKQGAKAYLDQDVLIEIAREYEADAIHPGYGFLAENHVFAGKVHKAGLIFIGSSADNIKLMGDKITSKKQVKGMNIPVIPGYEGSQKADILIGEAQKIGFPVLIKASAGGGGKGMRVVEREGDFLEALASARREAKRSFLDDRVLLEKYLENPRHVEIQILSDGKGSHLHFYERECSIQRRHQKILEESPAPGLDDHIRNSMTKAALLIARKMNFSGLGTVEFILNGDDFYFLEMNTRLQVEHPVTEMVCGFDLVRLQIMVAEGTPLNLVQDQIRPKGHAMEVRLCAEDKNYFPTMGTLLYVGHSDIPGVRLDTGFKKGCKITTDYDSLLGKLIARGADRDEVVSKLRFALREVLFFGVKNNREQLLDILHDDGFLKGDFDTNFLTHMPDSKPTLSMEKKAVALAAWLSRDKKTMRGNSPWRKLAGWRNL